MFRVVSFLIAIFFAFHIAFAQSSGKITGTVLFGADKSPFHDVSVDLLELKRTVITNESGVFEFTNIPPGKYTVHVHIEGFADAAKPVVVTAGGTATVNFEMMLTGVKAQVTVTASGTEQLTIEAIESVSTVDSSQIASRASVGLGDVVNGESGVTKRSAGPAASRPVIRGFDGDRVLVSTDGVRVGSLSSQSGDHAEPVDALSVERIEVVKGPATLLYGSNAIGGVVNAISGHDEGAHPGLRGYFSTIGGLNNGQAAVSGGVEYGVGPWKFWGNGSGQRTGDYKAGGDFGEVQNSFTRSASANFGGGYFGSKAFATAKYGYYQSRYGIPLEIFKEDPEERMIPVHRHDGRFNFGYNDPNWVVTGIKFTVDLSKYRHQEIHGGEVGTTFKNNVYSFRGMFEQKKFGYLSGRFGVEGYERDFSTVGEESLIDGPVEQKSFSVFGLEEIKLKRMSFQFGARIENNRYRPENAELMARDFTGFSGAVGGRFDLWEGGAFVANFTHAYRSPALEELYNNGPHDGTLTFEVGNPLLKAEKNNGIDLSLRHQKDRVRAEANFYYYNLSDFIFLAPTGEVDKESGFPIAEYLQDDSRFVGTELSLDVKVTNYLNVFTGLDYVNAELEDGRPLPRIAPLRGRLGLDFHHKNFSVRPEFIAVGDQDRVFTNETPTPGYGIFNISANYVISRKHFAHIFSVNAFNLTDKLYYNHVSVIKDISPEIGRGARFSYTVRFF